MISARSSPLENTRTTELCETATATAPVCREIEAAAAWRVPSPAMKLPRVRDVDVDEASGRDERAVVLDDEGAVELRELLRPSRGTRRFAPASSSAGCPYSGSRSSGRERSSTVGTSPITNSVPILRPSRPSRASSTASSTTLSTVSLRTDEQRVEAATGP